MTVSLTTWVLTVVAIVALLVIDFIVTRNPHDVSFREAGGWSVFYIAAAALFGG